MKSKPGIARGSLNRMVSFLCRWLEKRRRRKNQEDNDWMGRWLVMGRDQPCNCEWDGFTPWLHEPRCPRFKVGRAAKRANETRSATRLTGSVTEGEKQ